MMAAPAIVVENLSKRYYIGARQRYSTLRDQIMELAAAPIHNLRRFGRASDRAEDVIWALRHVSFQVEPGEVIGVIGRNGAGKSTLLKILTRITEPTSGRAVLRGRVGSLLEVGTGFHPELTGRENIFLSGAILGITRPEIKACFDEIVAFSGVEKFIDTPVKRYSSGMNVRLGFAIAAHLQSQILLVDEVLAVGDAEFQKKCLGKMGDVARGGRTVLFVSHNMGAIRSLCDRAILLDDGRIAVRGNVPDVVTHYLRGTAPELGRLQSRGSRFLKSVEFLDPSLEKIDSLLAGEGGVFRVHFDTGEEVFTNVSVTIGAYDPDGIMAAMLSTHHSHETPTIGELQGEGQILCRMHAIPVAPGPYQINVALDGMTGGQPFHDGIVDGCRLTILPSDYLGPSRMDPREKGYVLIKQVWSVE
jgi:lipopolysaccharide transport system ATP-binding protein